MEQSADFIRDVISENLKNIRKNMGLSLDQVSEQTGVSKSMIRQIEHGDTSPSISTLWKIALGLHIPFTLLLEKDMSETILVNKANLTPLSNGDSRYHLYAFFPAGNDCDFEILFIDMEPGAESESMPHAPGTTEYIVVTGGAMEVQVADQVYQVEPEGGIFFAADKPHAYRNKSGCRIQATMVIRYGAKRV